MDENYAKIALVSEPKAAVSYCLKVFKETAHSLEVCQPYIDSRIIGFDIFTGRGRIRHCRLWW